MGRRISKEFLHPSILEGVNNKIGNLDSLETDAKGNMVQAINELVEKLDNSAEIENGKELIANAIGEPLTAEESFDKMSSDINNLLSQFKTNMMNNGITVNSGDKFKQLIDKIATMVEEGSGKGIQFASGDTIEINYASRTDYGTVKTTINTNLNFTPNYVFVCVDTLINSKTHKNVVFSNLYKTQIAGGTLDGTTVTVTDIRQESFKISVLDSSFNLGAGTWYAIGVGEEDTTLRDSLASILENKGVDVTEEDDMASLITKVDSIGGGLDIISATELPATGKENQICVITNNPVDKFIFSKDEPSDKQVGLVWFKVEEQSSITTSYSSISNNVEIQYHLRKCFYYDGTSFTEIDGYIYNNGWESLSKSYVFIDKDGLINFKTFSEDGVYANFVSGKGLVFNVASANGSSRYESQWVSKTKVDFSPYTTLTFEFTVTAPRGDWSYEGFVCCGYGTTSLSNYFHSTGGWTGGKILYYNMSGEDSTDLSGKKETVTFDISGVNTECYVSIEFGAYLVTNVVLTSISLS